MFVYATVNNTYLNFSKYKQYLFDFDQKNKNV
jgi:hypothetical protein